MRSRANDTGEQKMLTPTQRAEEEARRLLPCLICDEMQKQDGTTAWHNCPRLGDTAERIAARLRTLYEDREHWAQLLAEQTTRRMDSDMEISRLRQALVGIANSDSLRAAIYAADRALKGIK